MELRRNSDPSNVRVPYKVVMIPAGKAYRFICLTDGYVDLLVHYTGTGAKVCPETPECQSCLGGSRQIFSGYVIGCTESDSSLRLVHLTGLAAFMLNQEEWRQGSLYGAKMILNRIGEKKNGPVEAFITGWRDDLQKLPMEALEHAVKTLYKLHRTTRQLGVNEVPKEQPVHKLSDAGINGDGKQKS
jgi:hypothetical protein